MGEGHTSQNWDSPSQDITMQKGSEYFDISKVDPWQLTPKQNPHLLPSTQQTILPFYAYKHKVLR